MFELKYKITDADGKAVNMKSALRYFVSYLVVALVGVAIGGTAIVLRHSTTLLVMGIILTVMGAFLLVCSVLLMLSPKNFAASALVTSDDTERCVRVDVDGITVTSDAQNSDIVFEYCEITKVRMSGGAIVAHIGKDMILIFKNAITSGGTFAELYAFLCDKTSAKRKRETAQPAMDAAHSQEPCAEIARETDADNAKAENTDGE